MADRGKGGGSAATQANDALRLAFLSSAGALLDCLACACVTNPTAAAFLANTTLDMNCGPFVTLMFLCFMLLGACGGNLRYAYYCHGATIIKAALPYLSIRFCALSGAGKSYWLQNLVRAPLEFALGKRMQDLYRDKPDEIDESVGRANSMPLLITSDATLAGLTRMSGVNAPSYQRDLRRQGRNSKDCERATFSLQSNTQHVCSVRALKGTPQLRQCQAHDAGLRKGPQRSYKARWPPSQALWHREGLRAPLRRERLWQNAGQPRCSCSAARHNCCHCSPSFYQKLLKCGSWCASATGVAHVLQRMLQHTLGILVVPACKLAAQTTQVLRLHHCHSTQSQCSKCTSPVPH